MGMIKEFKEFAVRGNLVDTAVAFVMGVSFGKIVTSFVDGIIMPLVGMLTGGVDFNDKKRLYYLKDNGEVWTLDSEDSLLKAIHYDISSLEGLDKYRLFGGVKKIFSQGFLMDDETIWSIHNC